MTETRREIALRHVITGRRIVDAQKARIARLRALGKDTSRAEQLLTSYEDSLAIFEHDLQRLME